MIHVQLCVQFHRLAWLKNTVLAQRDQPVMSRNFNNVFLNGAVYNPLVASL